LFTDGRSVTTFPADDGATLPGVAGWDGEPDPPAGGAGAGAAHDSETPRIGNLTGKLNADTGVPGGTSTVNDNLAPPTTVTVTTHCSADAGADERSPTVEAASPTVPAMMTARTRRVTGLGVLARRRTERS
jgi:hypothetical protein